MINENLVVLDLQANSKNEAIEEMAALFHAQGRVESKEDFIQSLLDREEQFPTAIGHKFSIPHGKSNTVLETTVAFARLQNDVKWSEEEEAKYVFMIGVPDHAAGNDHLKLLAKISRKIMDPDFRESVMSAQSKETILQLMEF